MNVCILLVISLVLQYLFIFLIKLILPQLVGITWFSFLQITVVSLATVFLPAYLYLKDEKKSYFTDCFKGVKYSNLIPLSVGIGVCAQYTGIALNIPVNYLIYLLGGNTGSNMPVLTSFPLLLGGIIVFCSIPAVFEEVLFRGIVYNYFRQYGTKAAIIISAFLFSIMHLDYSNTLGTFLLGIICGLMVKYTNRIIYPMITHFCMNFVSAILSYISNFEIISSIYSDVFLMFIVVSIPLIIYFMGLFKQTAQPLPYHDQKMHDIVTEREIKINEESSIKIYEHDVRKNNFKMAVKKLTSNIYFYIILIFFIYIGATKL